MERHVCRLREVKVNIDADAHGTCKQAFNIMLNLEGPGYAVCKKTKSAIRMTGDCSILLYFSSRFFCQI